jgi:hypothetical protein
MSFQTNFNEGQKQSNHILSHFSFEFKQKQKQKQRILLTTQRFIFLRAATFSKQK